MANISKQPRQTTRAMLLYGLVTVIYIILIFAVPANKSVMEAYNLTPSSYHILLFGILLSSILVWPFGFYAYARLYEYSSLIKGSAESSDFFNLARGVMWLALSLPLTAIISMALVAVGSAHDSLSNGSIIASNYVTLLIPLIAFSFAGTAARGLARHTKARVSSSGAPKLMAAFVAGGVLYCYLIFRNLDPTNLTSTNNKYFLPVWMVAVTIIVPYLYAWFIGILAALEISTYSKFVRGVLYRQPLRLIAAGLIIVIASFIATQYLGSVVPTSGHLELNSSLALKLLFRVASGIGFLLIAIGAHKLKRIEEV
ncbi:MAG TPA: hypothetical protein VLG27_02055 [Candidatus Saccharimonadia bacterium]|nr:hypothetical protein [Candidatus Saccharimonadia bacterium]